MTPVCAAAVTEVRYFRHKKLCHLWDSRTERFERLEPVYSGQLTSELHRLKPLSLAEQDGRSVGRGEGGVNRGGEGR